MGCPLVLVGTDFGRGYLVDCSLNFPEVPRVCVHYLQRKRKVRLLCGAFSVGQVQLSQVQAEVSAPLGDTERVHSGPVFSQEHPVWIVAWGPCSIRSIFATDLPF